MKTIKLIKLSDLEERHDGLYYVGHLVDIDGSPWVEKSFALKIIDIVNSELNQPIL